MTANRQEILAGREAIADEQFENYDFGDGVNVAGSDNWNGDDLCDLTKIVYITCQDDAPEADSEKVSFHVRFNEDGTVSEAYGLLFRNGSDIGCMRPSPIMGGKSISDDDICSGCKHCTYKAGELSACSKGWPGVANADGYIETCAVFLEGS